MVEIKVIKNKIDIKVEGMTEDIIAEMVVAVKGFYDTLAKGDAEVAECFRRTIFLNEDLIFRKHDKDTKN